MSSSLAFKGVTVASAQIGMQPAVYIRDLRLVGVMRDDRIADACADIKDALVAAGVEFIESVKLCLGVQDPAEQSTFDVLIEFTEGYGRYVGSLTMDNGVLPAIQTWYTSYTW